MTDAWYDLVPANERLTQGDVIPDCPLVGWKKEAASISEMKELEAMAEGILADVIVLTQACDLKHDKVENVLLCPHIPLSEFKTLWERAQVLGNQNPTAKNWKKLCDNIADGFIWHHAMLDRFDGRTIQMEARIVDFHDVYTVPRLFLETFLAGQGKDRLRLRPPYREHLSQAFARFFMRVGLPLSIEKQW